MDTGHGLQTTLVAAGRAAEIPEAHDVYGWLVGSWTLDIRRYRVDTTGRGLQGEAHFGWVLEGRAIQDVWILPRRTEGSRRPEVGFDTYGTTLRVYDPALEAWRVTWINPVTGARDELVGRRVGDDIVQVGRHADGTPIRWMFTETTPDSFRWTGEALAADGRTWTLEAEFRATRRR
jgi:hypothetical protein